MGDEQFPNRHALRVTFRQTRRGAPSYCKRASSVLTRKLKHPSRTPPPPELNGLTLVEETIVVPGHTVRCRAPRPS